MEIEIFAERIGNHLRVARLQHRMKQAAVAEALELCVLYHLTPNDLLGDCCAEFLQMEFPSEKEENDERAQLFQLLNLCSDTIIHMTLLCVQAWYKDEEKE